MFSKSESKSKDHGVPMNQAQLNKEAEITIEKLMAALNNPSWEKKDDKPCVTYSMKSENGVIAKGEAIIKASLKQVEDYIDNQKNYLPDNVVANKVLVEGTNWKVKYRRHSAVWPMDDRDLVMIRVKTNDGKRLIVSDRSINYEFPLEKGVIRAVNNIGGFIVDKISENEVKLTSVSDIDFKGSIPGMIKKKISEAQGKMPAKFRDAIEKK